MPTCLMHQQGYQRLPKQSPHILADGNANKAVQQMRKRKMDGGLDDSMGQPSKTKFVPHSKYQFSKIRPLNRHNLIILPSIPHV